MVLPIPGCLVKVDETSTYLSWSINGSMWDSYAAQKGNWCSWSLWLTTDWVVIYDLTVYTVGQFNCYIILIKTAGSRVRDALWFISGVFFYSSGNKISTYIIGLRRKGYRTKNAFLLFFYSDYYSFRIKTFCRRSSSTMWSGW